MPVVNAYCTAADVRTELGDDTGKLDTGPVQKAVNAASRAVDRYCGRRFWRDAAPVTRLYRPTTPSTATWSPSAPCCAPTPPLVDLTGAVKVFQGAAT